MLFSERAVALDAGYEPHDFEGWAELPAGDHECIGTLAGPIRVPRLLLLMTFNRVPRSPVRLSRRNIFRRDAHTCQYCGETPPLKDLNIDHVVPRSRGGRSTWDNLVASCHDCNRRKGGQLLAECGMEPANKPRRPRWNVAVHLAAGPRHFEEWEPFLGEAAAE